MEMTVWEVEDPAERDSSPPREIWWQGPSEDGPCSPGGNLARFRLDRYTWDDLERSMRPQKAEAALNHVAEERAACYAELRKQIQSRLTTSELVENELQQAKAERDRAVSDAQQARLLSVQLQASRAEVKRLTGDLETSHEEESRLRKCLAEALEEIEVLREANTELALRKDKFSGFSEHQHVAQKPKGKARRKSRPKSPKDAAGRRISSVNARAK